MVIYAKISSGMETMARVGRIMTVVGVMENMDLING